MGRIVFNEVQTVTTNFDGAAPNGAVTGPAYGSIQYLGGAQGGLFNFQVGAAWGPLATDWVQLDRYILYLDEANIATLTLDIVYPDGMTAPIIRNLVQFQNFPADAIFSQHITPILLPPRASLRLITTGALVPQRMEVMWWVGKRVEVDAVTGNDRMGW